MEKVPTLFLRAHDGRPPYYVTPDVAPGCEWVLEGEGQATRKFDGTCCQAWGGKLWRRREVKPEHKIPAGFRFSEHDIVTGKTVGWMECSAPEPNDRTHLEALMLEAGETAPDLWLWEHDGQTFELCGPKVQGNPEGFSAHVLIPHGRYEVDAPRDHEGLKAFLAHYPHEGIVWRHPDGRMAKLKVRDFPRPKEA